MPYKQSHQYDREANRYSNENMKDVQGSEDILLNYIISNNALKNDPQAIINAIDEFCQKTWMMNLGEEKSKIVIEALKKYHPKNIIQVGGYIGYSALVLAHNSKAIVHTIEISKELAAIAHKIHEHAGLADRIKIHVGTVSTSEQYILKNGPYDFFFIDHVKNLYLQDFLCFNKYGVIQKDAVVVGDNIICPGSPDYLAHFKDSEEYDSTLYFTYVEYTDVRDGVLVSRKLV